MTLQIDRRGFLTGFLASLGLGGCATSNTSDIDLSEVFALPPKGAQREVEFGGERRVETFLDPTNQKPGHYATDNGTKIADDVLESQFGSSIPEYLKAIATAYTSEGRTGTVSNCKLLDNSAGGSKRELTLTRTFKFERITSIRVGDRDLAAAEIHVSELNSGVASGSYKILYAIDKSGKLSIELARERTDKVGVFNNLNTYRLEGFPDLLNAGETVPKLSLNKSGPVIDSAQTAPRTTDSSVAVQPREMGWAPQLGRAPVGSFP
jgi:hypothetical protein